MEIKVLASGSTGNAYTISDGATTLLLDAGISLKDIRVGTGFKVRQIAGALITHEHMDHSKAMKDLSRMGVDIYASRGTMEACGLCRSQEEWAAAGSVGKYGVSGHRFHAVKALEELDIGTFRILPFDVEHDAVEPLGFLITSKATMEKLVYFTDTYFVRYRFNGLNYIMGECNYTDEGIKRSLEEGSIPLEFIPRLVRSHMSLENFLNFLRANDLRAVRQIWLLHLSENNSEAQRMKEEVQRLTGTEVYVC